MYIKDFLTAELEECTVCEQLKIPSQGHELSDSNYGMKSTFLDEISVKRNIGNRDSKERDGTTSYGGKKSPYHSKVIIPDDVSVKKTPRRSPVNAAHAPAPSRR